MEGGSNLSNEGWLCEFHAVRPICLPGLLKQELRLVQSDALKETQLCFVGISVPERDVSTPRGEAKER